jgi:DNA polymerase elongation subunit (family B)
MQLSKSKVTEILGLIKTLKDYKQIAKYLGIKETTAERYVRYVKNNTETEFNPVTLPKILLLDIETLPCLAYIWGIYKQQPTFEQIVKDWCIVTWSAKWLYDNVVYSDALTVKEANDRNDKRILKSLWELLEECNVAIGHNINRFDIRKINARLIINGIKPPMPYQIIDTLKHSQKIGAFTSHKLNNLLKMLNKETKIETNYELWKRAAGTYPDKEDQQKAITEMLKYNENDVIILEDLYLALRPWMKSHPNVGLFSEVTDNLCPACGSDDLFWKGSYTTMAGRYKTFRCNSCGGIGRSRVSELSKNKRKSLTISAAR